MRSRQLVLRSLTYYWRTNTAVILGVATAVAVLGGALLVGDSVRGSLRDLVLSRLGRTDQVLVSAGLFREQLAADIASQRGFSSRFSGIVPLIAARGLVAVQGGGGRAGQASVYGVDDRFWRFHGRDSVTGPGDRDAYVSPALARQLDVTGGESILVRVQRPTDVPIESLHGQRDNLGRTLRLTVASVLPAESLGEFSLDTGQGDVLAVFVPLARLQQELDVAARVNTLLVSTGPSPPAAADDSFEALVRKQARLEDLGLKVEILDDKGMLAVGSDAGLLDAAHVQAATQAIAAADTQLQALFTYLANTIRLGDREVPYSLVTALPFETLPPAATQETASATGPAIDPIVLNSWTAAELRARPGDTVTLDYYVWEEPGQLVTRSHDFRVAGIVPIEAGDRNMAPTFQGISDSPTLDEWDPPFPVDLKRVRPVDEDYWERFRTTPKAFVPLTVGQTLWRSRYGEMTSIRFTPVAGQTLQAARDAYVERLRAAADPVALGLTVIDVRSQGLEASRGATNFGEYFVYFSFFIVVSALLLAALFFKLGIEQRIREVGLLRAVGFGPSLLQRLFLTEGVVLAVAGSTLGLLGALAYAWLMMFGLRSWWVDAVGTTALTLHVTPASLAGGALGGIVAATVCIWWTLRSLNRVSERALLMGELADEALTTDAASTVREGWRRWRLPAVAASLAILAVALLAAAATGQVGQAGAFFGAGSALLVAALCGATLALRRRARHAIDGHGWASVSRLGLRNATYRPARSVLSIAVIAAATFILIAVDAFRRGDALADTGPGSGVGGYSLIVETLMPIAHDPNTRDGRDALNLFALDRAVTFEPMRLLPGDDASCLNLYEPRNPRILAPSDRFLDEGRFAFQSSLATTDAERANPWLLLKRVEADGAVPVIADANSMTYVLHKKLGDDVVLSRGGREIRLRLVAALRDSIFQGELLMAQAPFRRLFPEQQGYRVMLVRSDGEKTEAARAAIADGLSDLGAQVTGTEQRLAQFHRVENTYLSTFQTLGGLGLLLGTVGLAAVLLRNVLERRRELALLGAVGYRRAHVLAMLVSENTLLLLAGLGAGALSAVLAIAPAVAERGGAPLTRGGVVLLIAVFATGLLSSLVAMRAAIRTPLLAALRSE